MLQRVQIAPGQQQWPCLDRPGWISNFRALRSNRAVPLRIQTEGLRTSQQQDMQATTAFALCSAEHDLQA